MKKLLDLLEVKNGLMDGYIDISDASEFMQREDNQNFIKSILERYDSGYSVLDEVEVEQVLNILIITYYIYTYSDLDTGIDDTTYDKLYDMASANGKSDMFITMPLIPKTEVVEEHHMYKSLRGTLSKIHYLAKPKDTDKVNKTRKSLDGWISQMDQVYKEETGSMINFRDLEIYVFPKWDGVSAIFQFNKDGSVDKVLTRGFTKFNTAENISHHFKGFMRPVDPPKEYGLKTEILVSEDDLISYNTIYGKDYKQSRAIASGIINSKEADMRDKYLVIMQLRQMSHEDEIEKLCPEVFDHPYIRCKLGEYDKIESFAQNHHFVEGLRCDGAVIHIIDQHVQKVLGRKNDKNRFEVAYKFTEESAYSTVTGIDFQLGLFGRVAPVLKFKPVKIKGNTIDSASLGSMDRMEYLNFAVGDQVKVLYDIIPYATKDSHCMESGAKPIRPPKKCPTCGSTLVREGAVLSCKNIDCDWRKKGKILNYLVKMNIQDISYATVDTLYDLGILKSIKDLYRLDKHKKEILNIPGFGEDKYNNFITQIDSRRKVTEATLLGSIGIDGIAQVTMEKIFNVFFLDDLLEFTDKNDAEILTNVKGIGKSKAEKILQGFRENEKLITFLMEELDIIHEETKARFTVCFTKVRDPELESLISDLGGKTVNSVTATTDYCVVPSEDVESGKTRSALKNGVPIIVVDKLREELLTKYKK